MTESCSVCAMRFDVQFRYQMEEREGGFAKLLGREPRFPYVLGTDGAGTVSAVGDHVSRFKEGERVFALALANPKGGFYAEYAAVNSDNVARVPDRLTIEQAGVMPCDALTALTGLDDELSLKPGEALMIFKTSAAAPCCSSASSRSRVS